MAGFFNAITGSAFASAVGDYESIAGTVIVGAGGSSTITFSSIPATYKHLQIRMIGKGTAAASGSTSFRFNSNTSAVYTRHQIIGSGATVTAYGIADATLGHIYGYNDNLDTSSSPMAAIIDILDYKDTNKFKTVRTLSGTDKNGATADINLVSSLWRSTVAVSAIEIFIGGQNFGQYSHFALYGIK